MVPMKMLAVAVGLVALAAGCTRGPASTVDRTTAGDRPRDTLVVYARDPDLSKPLFKLFEQQTGIAIQAHWGNPIDLADEIIKDGAGSPADVYYGPLSGALGALRIAGRLAPLSAGQLDRVPAAYRSPDGTWVGTSGRAHVVFYNTDRVKPADLPDSILGFTDPAWRGRIGLDPTSRSLLDVVTELRQLKGDTAARQWLEGIRANQPVLLSGTKPIIKAVAAGTLINIGFGSHAYLPTVQAGGGAKNVTARFYRGGAPGGLLNVAGVGIIKGTDKAAAANAFVDFMLSPPVQRLEATIAFEIPLVEGADPPNGYPTAAELSVPGLDPRQLEDLDGPRGLLNQMGFTR